jgi:hypothetical protein
MKPGYSVAFTALTRQKVYVYIYPQHSYTVSAFDLGCHCNGHSLTATTPYAFSMSLVAGMDTCMPTKF